MRPDFFELAEHARGGGLRVVLSTNGLLLSEPKVVRLKELGFTYIGISLDGMEETHDHFRGRRGAFAQAMASFRRCVDIGLKVGLRLTLTSHTVDGLPAIFEFLERERIPRVCFYHLAPAGRGRAMELLPPERSREAIDYLLEKTLDFARRGVRCEILTVDNHCDGPFLLMKMRDNGDERAGDVDEMLRWNGGGTYSSGVGIANVDFVGDVHADQFWMTHSFGNVRKRPFSEIWLDLSDPIMAGLKDRKRLLKGRCGTCRWIDHCGGALRSRAAHITGDPWAADPACYLTDEEITAR
jgi:radical SAM protein with 4Fe4S-binding SPASM domain